MAEKVARRTKARLAEIVAAAAAAAKPDAKSRADDFWRKCSARRSLVLGGTFSVYAGIASQLVSTGALVRMLDEKTSCHPKDLRDAVHEAAAREADADGHCGCLRQAEPVATVHHGKLCEKTMCRLNWAFGDPSHVGQCTIKEMPCCSVQSNQGR